MFERTCKHLSTTVASASVALWGDFEPVSCTDTRFHKCHFSINETCPKMPKDASRCPKQTYQTGNFNQSWDSTAGKTTNVSILHVQNGSIGIIFSAMYLANKGFSLVSPDCPNDSEACAISVPCILFFFTSLFFHISKETESNPFRLQLETSLETLIEFDQTQRPASQRLSAQFSRRIAA